MMKKGSLLATAITVALAALTACMSEGGDKISVGNYPGVVAKRGDSSFVYTKSDNIIFSASGLSGADDGDCVIVDFTIDYAQAENLNSGHANGFLTAVVKKLTRLPQGRLNPTLSDTSKVLKNERTLSSVLEQNAFIRDRFFLFTSHRADSFPLQFSLSYSGARDAEQVYDLYLRIAAKVDDDKATQPVNHFNGFHLEELSRRETDSLFFRINYVKQFNHDSTEISWAATPVYRYKIFR